MDIITRKEALAQGLTHYFTGVPCKRGHVEFRFVLSRACIACNAERQRNEAAGPLRNGNWVGAASASCKAGLSFVYAYLRAKDTKHGLKGSPYYIGVGSNTVRPTQPHRVGCIDLVPSCPDQIVILRSFVTREKALEWETFYIDRYGLIDEGGILRNQTRNAGGIGKGYRWDKTVVEQRAATRWENTCKRYQLPPERLEGLTRGQLNVVSRRYQLGLRGEALLVHPPRRKGTVAQVSAAQAKKVAMAKEMGVDPAEYLKLDGNGRSRVLMRYRAGWPSHRLLDPAGARLAA